MNIKIYSLINIEINDNESIIHIEEPKINLFTISSFPFSKNIVLNKLIIYLLLILNFSINDMLNKSYYCRLISLYVHEKKILLQYFVILNVSYMVIKIFHYLI